MQPVTIAVKRLRGGVRRWLPTYQTGGRRHGPACRYHRTHLPAAGGRAVGTGLALEPPSSKRRSSAQWFGVVTVSRCERQTIDADYRGQYRYCWSTRSDDFVERGIALRNVGPPWPGDGTGQ
jgi:hypothetical protein